MKYKLILAIFILSLVSSGILSFVPTGAACGIDSGCSTVQTSDYAKTGNMKNSQLGVIAFLFLSLLTASQLVRPDKDKEKIIKLGIIGGSLVALYFIYLQQFVLHEYCKYCMVVDIGMLLALTLVFKKDKKNNSITIKSELK